MVTLELLDYRGSQGFTSSIQRQPVGSWYFGSFFFFIHLFICAYIVWAISPLCPPPHLSCFQAETVLPLFSNFVEEKT
jgi:hypothetical protein